MTCRLRILVLAGVALAAAADADAEPFCVETDGSVHRLEAELADSPRERARGLMDRQFLPADAGMLFRYPAEQGGDRGFWMYRTRIPLDAAFLDGEGRIRVVVGMQPCVGRPPQHCPRYRPGVPYRAVLEVNRGWFAERQIGPGARVVSCEAGSGHAAGRGAGVR